MLNLIAQTESPHWIAALPGKGSTFSPWVDPLYYFQIWLSVFFFVGIGGCMFYFAWKYRRRSMEDHPHGSHHNNTLEIVWSVIPLLIVMVIFVWGFRGFRDMVNPPNLSEEIVVTASRWNWSFQYSNGGVSPGTPDPENPDDENWGLIVPVNRPVRIVLKTPPDDVLHSFYIPAFRVKKDAVPGRYNNLWFEATQTGVYDLYCAEYCGQQHSQMRSRVKVVSEDEYYAYIADAANIMDKPLAEGGKLLFATKGCSTCHSVQGERITGPPLNDLFGREEVMADGSRVMADENYLVESIRNPSRRIVAGYQDQMTVIGVSDAELDRLIAYLKSISQHYAGNRDELFAEPNGE